MGTRILRGGPTNAYPACGTCHKHPGRLYARSTGDNRLILALLSRWLAVPAGWPLPGMPVLAIRARSAARTG